MFGVGWVLLCSAKAGGSSSPESNSQLADVLKKAREVGVPKVRIERLFISHSEALPRVPANSQPRGASVALVGID